MDLWLYVYGNGDFIYEILTSVNFFMNNAKSFFELAALISLLVFAFEATGVFPSRGYDWARFLRVFVIMGLFVMTPYPGSVNVHDVITNQDRTFNYKDGRLPFGMIVPIALTSTVIYRTIMLYQQNFEIDENLNYTYSGMNFGANFILSLDNVSSYSPNFDYNLDRYMQNCGFPLANKAGALSELRQSKDIFATLAKYTSASRYVQQTELDVGVGLMVVSCKTALEDLNSYYDRHKDEILHKNASMIGIDSGDAFTRYVNAANASAVELLDISQGAAAAMKQAIGMNVMMASLKNGALGVGNGSLALAAYDAEQFQQYKSTGALSGEASSRTIPVLVGVGFAILFLLYPVIIFMAISMGNYRGIGVYFQLLIGINLIPLIYELLNFITTFYLQKKLGTVIVGQGFSYEVSTTLYSLTDNMIVAGNYLATATPLIAYALVTGSAFALTSVFSHINDPAKSQSAQVGDQMAKGNQNIGNATVDSYSYNNLNSNKLDNQPGLSSGSPMMKFQSPEGTHTNFNGKDYWIQNQSQLRNNVGLDSSVSKSLTNSVAQSHQELGSLSKQWGNESRRMNDLANNESSSDTNTLADGRNRRDVIMEQTRIADSLNRSLDAFAGTPASFGIGVKGSAGTAWSHEKANALNKDLDTYQQNAKALAYSKGETSNDVFSSGASFAQTTSQTITDTVNKEKLLSEMQNTSSNVRSDLTTDFANYLDKQGIDPLKLDDTLKQREYAEQYLKQEVYPRYGIGNKLEKPLEHLSPSQFGQSGDMPNSDGLRPVDPNRGGDPLTAKQQGDEEIKNAKPKLEYPSEKPTSTPQGASRTGNYGTFTPDKNPYGK